MSYNKRTWATGNVVGAVDLNRMEDGIEDAGSGQVLVVNVTTSGGTTTADKTWQEIYDAFPNVYVYNSLASGKQNITQVISFSNEYDVYIYGFSKPLWTDTPTGYPSRITEK